MYKPSNIQDTLSPEKFASLALGAAESIFGEVGVFDLDRLTLRLDSVVINAERTYRQALKLESNQWPKVVFAWLHEAATYTDQISALGSANAWTQYASLLRVRLRRHDGMAGIHRRVGAGLTFSLVLELRQSCVVVSPAQLRLWRVGVTQAWWAGLRGNTANLQVERHHVEFNGIKILAFVGGLCTSGIFTCLGRHLPDPNKRPLYVAAPSAEIALVIPASLGDSEPDLNQLSKRLSVWFAKSAHPVSSEIFTYPAFSPTARATPKPNWPTSH